MRIKRKAVTERQLRDGENQIALPLELIYKITCILPILYHKDYFLSSINLNFLCGGFMKQQYIFPLILIALDVGAAVSCAVARDMRMVIYWLAAAVLNAAVTFK